MFCPVAVANWCSFATGEYPGRDLRFPVSPGDPNHLGQISPSTCGVMLSSWATRPWGCDPSCTNTGNLRPLACASSLAAGDPAPPENRFFFSSLGTASIFSHNVAGEGAAGKVSTYFPDKIPPQVDPWPGVFAASKQSQGTGSPRGFGPLSIARFTSWLPKYSDSFFLLLKNCKLTLDIFYSVLWLVTALSLKKICQQ